MYHLLIAVLGVAGLFGLWLGVQALGRRQSGDECDGPEMMACGACEPERAGRCSMRTVETDAE